MKLWCQPQLEFSITPVEEALMVSSGIIGQPNCEAAEGVGGGGIKTKS